MAQVNVKTPLNVSDRAELMKTVEARQKIVLQKKQQNDLLRKGMTTPSATPVTGGAEGRDSTGVGGDVTATSLLNDLLDSVAQAAANAATKVTDTSSVPELTASPGGGKGRISLQSGDDMMQFQQFSVGHLASSKQVDVIILPVAIDRFDKSCQADAPLPDEDYLEEAVASGEPLHGGARERVDAADGPRQASESKVTAEDIYSTMRRGSASGVKPSAIASETGKAGFYQQHRGDELFDEAESVTIPTEDEKKKILSSPAFGAFFANSTKLVERVLGTRNEVDILKDYSGVAQQAVREAAMAETVKKVETYQDTRWSAKRSITDIRTCSAYQDAFLCAYGQKTNAAVSDPDGCVLIWSLQMNKRPEYVFTCQSAVTTAVWGSYTPHVVIGGTFTGSIVVWDTRAKTRPVQRSPLSPKGHLHAIYSMEIVGTQHAHNLVSVDCDGRLCLWSMGMLVHPTESIDLKKGSKDLPVSVLCAGFAEGETNTLFGGANDGSIFQAHIHGSKTGITEAYEGGHTGPVTSVDWHKTNEGQTLDFTDLFLSTSVDWTVKLWNPKNHSLPIHCFEAAEDYVFDAKWHPSHPGVFASADASGRIDFWDMTRDVEMPVVRTQASAIALNKLKWLGTGESILTGDNSGVVGLWGVSQDLCAPQAEDWSKMEERVEELKQLEPQRRGPDL